MPSAHSHQSMHYVSFIQAQMWTIAQTKPSALSHQSMHFVSFIQAQMRTTAQMLITAQALFLRTVCGPDKMLTSQPVLW